MQLKMFCYPCRSKLDLHDFRWLAELRRELLFDLAQRCLTCLFLNIEN